MGVEEPTKTHLEKFTPMKAYWPIDYDKQLEADEQEGFFLLREPAHLIKPGIEEEKKEAK